MDNVVSKDGTLVAYKRSGTGQALILVHGTGADHTRWEPVLPLLESHFTVYNIDRRGRGQSRDTTPYAIARDFEDIAAVADSLDGWVNLLGHSYGGLCCLEAALLTAHVRRLILYEPPITKPGFTYPPGVLNRLQELLKADNREGVLTTFLKEIVNMPVHEIALLRSGPSWASRLAAAHTIPRELPDEGYVLDPRRFKNFKTPILLLLGGDSPPFLAEATEALHAAVQTSRIIVMQGQQHIAMNTAPELFVHHVVTFINEPD